jgi:hypothetical protein
LAYPLICHFGLIHPPSTYTKSTCYIEWVMLKDKQVEKVTFDYIVFSFKIVLGIRQVRSKKLNKIKFFIFNKACLDWWNIMK